MSRLVLFECCPDDVRVGSDDVLVATTPEACYELDRRGIAYKLTSDVASEEELASLEIRHWEDQRRWLEQLDAIVEAHVPSTRSWRFGAATLYAYYLKVLVDSVLVRAFELDRMLAGHDAVVLVRAVAHEDPIDPALFFHGQSLHSRLLPIFCAERNIPYTEQVIAASASAVLRAPPAGVGSWLKNKLRPAYHALRRFRSTARVEPAAGRLTFLFLAADYDLHYLLPRARARGHRCLLLLGDRIVEEGFLRRRVASLPVAPADARQWREVAEIVGDPGHELWRWLDDRHGVSLSELVRPRVTYWLREVMPLIAARGRALREVMTRESVDFVLAANAASRDFLAAASVAPGTTTRVLIDHGDGAFASEVYDLLLLRYVDLNFSSTAEFAAYMRERRSLYEHSTAAIEVGSYRARANARIAKGHGRPPLVIESGQQVVVYALTALAGDARYFNTAWYPDGWYYRLARSIVDVLAAHPEYLAVVKLFPGDGHLRNPIDRYVGGLGLDHLVVSREPLQEWLPWTDRALFDLPSTGLYEAARAGVPLLGLLWEHHRHRPTAVELFAPSLVPFRDQADAAAIAEGFLAAERVASGRLSPEGAEILETLERLAGRDARPPHG